MATTQVIGGQHRFEAISAADDEGVATEHGLKVYFDLDKDQRLDVQVISNTNISVSKDLLDRMYETVAGADLRAWCQKCKLLAKGQDFASKNASGSPITVQETRTFIVNYFAGKSIVEGAFGSVDTTPKVVRAGVQDPKDWRDVKAENSGLWTDAKLKKAGTEFAKLIKAQNDYYIDKKSGKPTGAAHLRRKARNIALISAWAFVAGALAGNTVRLKRHYELSGLTSRDPLRADLLAKGRHSSDAENYRGLGFRTDAKERGRFVELFWLQAEKGGGLKTAIINAGIMQYEAKQAVIAANLSKAKI